MEFVPNDSVSMESVESQKPSKKNKNFDSRVLEETVSEMRHYLRLLSEDLEKAVNGNRAAAQRVRIFSIQFTKISKIYRKESVAAHKKMK